MIKHLKREIRERRFLSDFAKISAPVVATLNSVKAVLNSRLWSCFNLSFGLNNKQKLLLIDIFDFVHELFQLLLVEAEFFYIF